MPLNWRAAAAETEPTAGALAIPTTTERPQQLLRRDRRSADPFGVDTIEASRQLLQRRVHQSPDRSKRMVLGNPGLQRYVAEDPTLERLRSSHISPLGLPSKVPFDEEFFSSLLGAAETTMRHRSTFRAGPSRARA